MSVSLNLAKILYPPLSTESKVSVWFSGNAFVSINVVTQRRARLVPGRVTALGRVNLLGAEPGTQVNSVSMDRRNEYPTKAG